MFKRFFFTAKRQIRYSSQLIFENPTVNTNVLCISCVEIACCSSEFRFVYLSSNLQNASEQLVLCTHHSFVNLPLHPNLQTKFKGNSSGDSKCYISLNIRK